MNNIYHWVGFAIVWLIITLFNSLIVFCAGYFLYKKVWMNDWFAFNIRRITISTEKLREGYAGIKMNKYWTRYTAKYRLRNIRRVK